MKEPSYYFKERFVPAIIFGIFAGIAALAYIGAMVGAAKTQNITDIFNLIEKVTFSAILIRIGFMGKAALKKKSYFYIMMFCLGISTITSLIGLVPFMGGRTSSLYSEQYGLLFLTQLVLLVLAYAFATVSLGFFTGEMYTYSKILSILSLASFLFFPIINTMIFAFIYARVGGFYFLIGTFGGIKIIFLQCGEVALVMGAILMYIGRYLVRKKTAGETIENDEVIYEEIADSEDEFDEF